MNLTVLFAIFRRDFISYFSNPTGYVFICVFVMLSALAAFWPPDFFSNNLANLDQLNRWLPFILLVYIPAITMSIWAEERRLHTDELLLTLPASDTDVVLGKYLASVAIYSVALLFSMFSIFLVFAYGLGSPDPGLFVCTYIGYWFIGLAMLAIGMVASFLTSNLTVGFILGMIFNLPLAMFGVADWIIKNPQIAQAVKQWVAMEQFRDFQRGVLSMGGMAYFVMIAVVMLYISMVLIGRRHWGGREEEQSMWLHYMARTLGLVALAVGINMFLSHHNSIRADMTSGNLNSLSPQTVKLIRELGTGKDAKTIKIDAYVSPQVPAEYAPHKLNLLSTLNEMGSLSGNRIQVEVHEIENFSDEAANAEKAYGIEPREVQTMDRGARKSEEVFLGVAFTSGLDRVVIPFIDKGIPVEYELARSIRTVANQKRKTLGVLKTDYPVLGETGMPFMQQPTEDSQLVVELKKQYDVVMVDPTREIKERYDVLLAVQPSSLNTEQMKNFVAAVKAGQPTAVFEDPLPLPQLGSRVVGTAQPKFGGGGPMGMGGQPEEKGDISLLWKLLGVEMNGNEIVWQNFNPEPKLGEIYREWIFIDEALAGSNDGNSKSATLEPFSRDDPISKGMRQVLFFFPGSFKPKSGAKMDYKGLAVTGHNGGTITYENVVRELQTNDMHVPRQQRDDGYIIAMHVQGKAAADADLYLSEEGKGKEKDNSKAEPLLEDPFAKAIDKAAEGENKTDEKAKAEDKAAAGDKAKGDAKAKADEDPLAGKAAESTNINVVLVADVDWIAPVFFQLRSMGQDSESVIEFKFQNVEFVLNLLDSLAGDEQFIDVRKRTRAHRILTKVEEATQEEIRAALKEQEEFIKDADKQIAVLKGDRDKKLAELMTRSDLDYRAQAQRVSEVKQLDRMLKVKTDALEKERNRQVKQSERRLASTIRGVQDRYKLLAVLLPPILPILLAFFVYFHRRMAEQEGVDARRLRYGRVAEDTPGAPVATPQ